MLEKIDLFRLVGHFGVQFVIMKWTRSDLKDKREEWSQNCKTFTDCKLEKMKQKLKEKYPLHDYQDDPYDQLTGVRQGGLMMIEHVNKFE